MIISCGFICVFALINKVSLQETVRQAVIGGSVLLPCSSTKVFKLQDINVFWRHNGVIVCDIIPSSRSLEKQDPEYKNRTETFPEEYERGNFSIKLHKLISADAGEYTCLISHSSEKPTVQLIINDSTPERVTISTEEENRGETDLNSVEKSSPSLWVVITSVIIVIVTVIGIVIGLIVAWRIRKNSSSRRHNMSSDAHEVAHMNQ